MRAIPVGYFQRHISRELHDLPFIVTRNKKKFAKVLPYAWDTKPDDVEQIGNKDILKEVVSLGINYYREHPEKISPTTLVNAVNALEKMQTADEFEQALIEATGESILEEEDDQGANQEKLEDGEE